MQKFDISRISHKSLLGRVIRLPLKLIPKNHKLRVLQGANKNYRWLAGSGINLYWWGTFEIHKQKAISECYKKDMVAYDIGAHVGFYTLMFSRLSGNEGRVYSFEPNARNQYYLKTHLDINNIKNVTILPIALGQVLGYTFFNDETSDSSTGYITSNHTPLIVPTDSIDNLMDKKLIDPPDIIKIDVEGSELSVLYGTRTVIQEYKPIIFIAIDNHDEKDLIYDFLNNVGYEIELLDNNPYEIKAAKKTESLSSE